MWARLLTIQKVYTKCFECIRYTADCVLRNIGTNAFFLSFEVVFFKQTCRFFIVRLAIIKKKNILMTQRAEGICVEKMDMPNLIKLCGVGGEGRVRRVVYRCRVRVTVRF